MTAVAEPVARELVPASVGTFLGHLGVGVHKLRAYPPGHPMRHVAVEAAFRALGELLADEPSWRLGVGQTQFVVGNAVTDPDHFIIRDLAARLHRRQVGGLVFHRGLTLTEFAGALEVLATEAPRSAFGPNAETIPESPTARVEFAPIALDALGLRDGSAALEVERLWQDLARLVGLGFDSKAGSGDGAGGGPGSDGGLAFDPELALLAERFAKPEVQAALASTLERLGRMAQYLDGQARLDIDAKIEALLGSIPREALAKALEINLGHADGRARLLPASEWLPTLALVEIIESAARDEGQQFSSVFLRLIRKMAGQSGNRAPHRAASGRDVRLLVRALVQDWTLADPNSKAHAHILDSLTRQDIVSPGERSPTTEGLRLTQIALETEAVGDLLAEAVEQVLAAGNVADLLQLLAEVPDDNPAAEAIWSQLVAPANLRHLLDHEGLRPDVVRQLLSRVGLDGVDLLLDRLLAISNLDIQRQVVEHVLSLGGRAQLAVLERVQRATPEQRRHYLHILSQVTELPAGFSAKPYLDAAEPLVRLEALRLMVRVPEERDHALFHALADDDERVARFALEAGRSDLPRHCLSRLMQLLNSPRRSPELKARAIPALAQFDTPSIRQWLLTGLVVRRGWLRRRKIAPTSSIVVAKLALLAERWADHPEVARTLDVARASTDPEVVAAATGVSR